MIYLASDHRGFELKKKISVWLKEWGYQSEDMGPFAYDAEDDYPDFVLKAAEKISADPENSKGIVLGHSGQGEALVANKYKGIRAIVYYGGPEELITLSREHNNANVLSLGASFLDDETAKKAVKTWLETKFAGEERHVRRIAKIAKIEENIR
ncbi:MAG: ribose 5-phosphate isomerase B [Parcubacteria group bacterium Licking1014_17]|nr:MAG: ribose 5-phosphate isomerase B [Parcubacteria group bacterium Licking1014_17]